MSTRLSGIVARNLDSDRVRYRVRSEIIMITIDLLKTDGIWNIILTDKSEMGRIHCIKLECDRCKEAFWVYNELMDSVRNIEK